MRGQRARTGGRRGGEGCWGAGGRAEGGRLLVKSEERLCAQWTERSEARALNTPGGDQTVTLLKGGGRKGGKSEGCFQPKESIMDLFSGDHHQ